MSVAPTKVAAFSAVSGYTPDGQAKLQVSLTPVDTDLRLGRPAKFILEIKAPAATPTPLGDNWTDDQPFVPEPEPKSLGIRFTFHSPDRGFLTGPSATRGRQGTLAVTDGEVTRLELEAQPVKREGQLRLSLYTEKELDLIGDIDLTLKAT